MPSGQSSQHWRTCLDFDKTMSVSLTVALAPWLGRVFSGASASPPWNDTTAIREAIFSVERMEEHARSLARAQAIKPRRQYGRPLHDRLAANEASLIDSYRSISRAVDDKAAITPAAEWLIDNFHLVERQIREIRLDLPPPYYRELAQARRRSLCRAAAGVRPGLGVRRAHRQPLRCRYLVRVHPRLPGGSSRSRSANCGLRRSPCASSWSRI